MLTKIISIEFKEVKASSKGIGIPERDSANDLALSKVLLVFIKETFLCFNALAIRLAPSPEPISNIFLSSNLPIDYSARLTATDPTETRPLLIPVSDRTLLPTLKDFSKMIERKDPR